MARAIPASPYTPKIEWASWGFFILIFVYFLWQGFNDAWLKTYAYLLIASSNDQTNGRTIFMYELYAYAYAYVRVALLSLIISLVLIIFRMMEFELDSNALFEFVHYRHWPAHISAILLFVIASMVQSTILFSNKAITKSKEESSRQFTRICIISISLVTFFYMTYIAKVVYNSSLYCYVFEPPLH